MIKSVLTALFVGFFAFLAVPASRAAEEYCENVVRKEAPSGGYVFCADNTWPYYFHKEHNIPGHVLSEEADQPIVEPRDTDGGWGDQEEL